MSDIFTQIGDKNIQVKNTENSSRDWVKIAMTIITTIGVIVAALLASPWLPQIWNKIKTLF